MAKLSNKMKKLSDLEVKRHFKILKKLMFWPHPNEYEAYFHLFHLKKKTEDIHINPSTLARESTELRKVISEFPLSVYIETTNYCNLKCKMCPNATLGRKKQDMPDKTFYKIVDEIAEKQPSICVSPFYFGEPLVSKKIFERIKYCKSKGLTFIKLSTNGSLLYKNDNYKRLIDCGLDFLIISFDAVEKSVYESIRAGSNYERFIQGVKLLVDYKNKTKSKITINAQMIYMDETLPGQQSFINFVKNIGLSPYFTPLQYWNSKIEGQEDLNKTLRYSCNNPLYSAVIHSNGDLVSCCMDYEGKCKFGNLNDYSLEYLWKEKHVKLRQAQLKGNYEAFKICTNCFDWMTFGYNKYAEVKKLTEQKASLGN